MMSIRAEMAKENAIFEGIVEADKTYIAGKRRKDYDQEDTNLYADQSKGYNEAGDAVKKHETLNRLTRWEEGTVHTNTIKGF
ncbi:hypothetical protein F4212_02680 [Candidatus Poribacteria bacterium]|nr:hypothetical protein [Candidatus Poribacteria bacterium]